MNFQSRSVIATFLVLGTIFMGYFAIRPQWKNFTESNKKIESARAEKSRLEKAQDDANKFLEEYNEHVDEVKVLGTALPLNEVQVENILASLHNLASQSGVALASLTTVSLPDSDPLGAASYSIQPLDYNVSISGSYEGFKNFILNLEKSLRVMDVRNITVQGSENANDYSFTLGFRTYYQK